ncbi:MAG: hypothetical protein QM630_03705 [Microbacterium sp.]
MLKKLAAISLTAGALVLTAPVAADAATDSSDSYAGTPSVSVSDPIVDTCAVSTIAFGSGWFQPSENVDVSVSGYAAADAVVSGNIAAADGSLVLTFRPPSDGEGSYAVAFSGSRSYTATLTVSNGQDSVANCDHDPAVSASGASVAGSSTELALTGGSVSPWILGAGATALIAGGTLVAVGIHRRKNA